MQPQAPIVLSPHSYCMQHTAIRLLEQGATATGPLQPPIPPLPRHISNVTQSSPHQQQCYQPEMVASKAPPPAKFCGDMINLEGWILWVDDYFTIMQTDNKQQMLPYIGLYMEEELLAW